jgi:hypothetical protein
MCLGVAGNRGWDVSEGEEVQGNKGFMDKGLRE